MLCNWKLKKIIKIFTNKNKRIVTRCWKNVQILRLGSPGMDGIDRNY